MTAVLLFVEHEMDEREVAATLGALAGQRAQGERAMEVTVVVPYVAAWETPLMDDLAAARGMAASFAVTDSRRDVRAAVSSARMTLDHAVAEVGQGGHVVRGELVAVRDVVPDLVAEAASRGAHTVLVVTTPHRFSHLLHRDLEHRLRHAGVATVLRIHGETAPVRSAVLGATTTAEPSAET